MKQNDALDKDIVFNSHGISKVAVIVIIAILTTAGAGVGGYFMGSKKANDDLALKDQTIKELRDQAKGGGSGSLNGSTTPTPAAGAAVSGSANSQLSYQSANLGFSVSIPKEWIDQWRYHENGEIGISTASTTFYLINKETKFAEVVTVGKIPQTKYDAAKASGDPVANPDNYLGAANGSVYIMTFPTSQGDYKNFTYAQAVKAVRDTFKASFKTI